MDMTLFGSSGKVSKSSSVAACHNRIVLSSLPLASKYLFGANATTVPENVCPVRVALTSPVWVFHNRITFSSVAAASVCPSRLSEMDLTPCVGFGCVMFPVIVFRSSPVWRFQNRIVLSQLPLMSVVSSGEYVREGAPSS